jgi:hypothetical protein
MKYIITESQYKAILNEYYDSEKLYRREHVVKMLSRGPRYIKEYIKNLPKIQCTDNDGNEVICTKIPEVIYQFLYGNF